MMIISSLPNIITSNINNFFFQNENDCNYISQNFLNINADDLITIFIYILIKSQMSSILIHIKIINEFTTKTIQKNNYYILTLNAAIEYIQQDEIKNNFNKNENL